MISQRPPSLDVAELDGVGPKTAALLRELGVDTAQALLDYLPFRYEDLRFPTPALRLGEGSGEENAVGRVVAVKEKRVRGLEIVELQVRDDAGDPFAAKWIGRNRYVVGRFHEGMRLFVRGRVERTFSGPVVNVSQHGVLGEDERYRGELVPVYRASKDLASRKIAMVMKKNLATMLDLAPADVVPPQIAAHRGYGSLPDAYRSIHAPQTPEEAAGARERFIFAEFLALATGAQLRRAERESDHDARPLEVPADLARAHRGTASLCLDRRAARVIDEIARDMRPHRADEPPPPGRRRQRQNAGRGGSDRSRQRKTASKAALMAPTEMLGVAARAETRAAVTSLRHRGRSRLRRQNARSRKAASPTSSQSVSAASSRSARTRSSRKASTSLASAW